LNLQAQQNSFFALSIWNPSQINIASAAQESSLSINGAYRKNWSSFTGGPILAQLSLETSKHIEKSAWAGFVKSYSNALSRSFDLKIGYRQTFAITPVSKISFGIRSGWFQTAINTQGLKAVSPEEIYQIKQGGKVNKAVLDFGLLYSYKLFSFGISSNYFYSYSSQNVNNILANKILPDNSIQLKYCIKKNEWEFTPYFILRSSYGLPALLEFSCTGNFQNKYKIAAGMRTSKTLFIMASVTIKSSLQIIYCFENSFTINRLAGTGNEIGLVFCPQNK
jgi:type IX secretion system PorP/SprF family membrane protein